MAYAVAGAVGVSNAAGTVPNQNRRKYYTPSDKVLFQEIAQATLLGKLIQEMGKVTVSDPEPRSLEDGYPAMTGTLTGCNSEGTAAAITTATDYFIIPNAETKLQPGEVIHVKGVQTNQTNASVNIYGENLRVMQILSTGTTAVVRLQRALGASSNTGGVTAGSGNTLKWAKLGYVAAEGSRSPEAITEAITEEQNYIEIVKSAYEETGTRSATDMYGGPDMPRNAKKAAKTLARLIERKFIFGQRQKFYTGDKATRFMGGLLYWLGNGTSAYTSYSAAKDLVKGTSYEYADRSRIWKVGDITNTDNWSRDVLIKEAIHPICHYGNGRKILFGGNGFLGLMDTLFTGQMRFDNGLKQFGIEVRKLDIGGYTLEMYPSPELSESGYNYDALIVDPEYVKIGVLKGRDLRVEKNIQLKDADTTKHQLVMDVTLLWGFWKAHSWITGITGV